MTLTDAQKNAILKKVSQFSHRDDFVFCTYGRNDEVLFMIQAKCIILGSPIPSVKQGKIITHTWLESETRFQAQNVFCFEVKNNEVTVTEKF